MHFSFEQIVIQKQNSEGRKKLKRFEEEFLTELTCNIINSIPVGAGLEPII